MTELFENIDQGLKDIADFFWLQAMKKETLVEKVSVLDTITQYYRTFGKPEEVEFLQFYFNMRMEMMKND